MQDLLVNFERRRFKTAHSRNNKKAWAVIIPPIKIRNAAYGSYDDFMNKIPIAALNEYGELTIGGTRIC